MELEKIEKLKPKWIDDFKAFAMKGNVIDLAVAVVVGGAFNTIVSSLVSDVIMPLVGVMTGGVNFSGLTVKVGEAMIKYGAFIQSIIDFLIIALSIFFAIRLLSKLKGREEAKAANALPAAVPPPTPENIVLLREIRDALTTKKAPASAVPGANAPAGEPQA